MSESNYSLLTQTDLNMAAMDGEVEHIGEMVVARRPNNPLYYWGNFLLLPRPPEATEIDGLIAMFRHHFAGHPAVKHVTLRWDGPALSEPAAALARQRGMSLDGGLEMVAETLSAPAHPDLVIRGLDMVGERAEMVALNIACDPAEQEGSQAYAQFKEYIRASWWVWHASGAGRWWGAFVGGELVGQCGLIHCANGLGRFQAVETHPDHRRQGVCSSLVAATGNAALAAGGCRSVLLGVDAEGPALGLYTSLGFRPGTTQHSLILGGEPTSIRLEAPGDQAEVRSILNAAFEQPDEARVVDALRDRPGVISLVAVRDSTILGHALFSPVSSSDGTKTARKGIALGPVAVRPSQQGQGVGSALIRDGLERCRQAGWRAAFVLGDPDYYHRFGWSSAADRGLRCQWKIPPGIFQAMELAPDGLAEWTGLVSYDPVFDSVS